MDRLSRATCLGFVLGFGFAAVAWYAAWVRWTTNWDEQ